jgi:hypothetical protein
MPTCQTHSRRYLRYENLRYSFVEEIAHGVHEDHLGISPPKRLRKLLRNHPEVETLLERMTLNTSEALGESLGIAMLTTGADLGAAANWIPRSISPFDF